MLIRRSCDITLKVDSLYILCDALSPFSARSFIVELNLPFESSSRPKYLWYLTDSMADPL